MKYLPYLLFFVLAAACGSAVAEREPNDTLGQAQPVEAEAVIRGELSSATDVDCFSIDVPDRRLVNRALRLRLLHDAAADLRVDIHRDDRLIKRIDDWAAQDAAKGRKPKAAAGQVVEEFANLALVPGRLVFRISRADGTTFHKPIPYELQFSHAPRSEFGELEPNDGPPHAQPIEAGVAFEGYCSPGSNPLHNSLIDQDWYRLTLEMTNTALLDIELSGVPGVDLVLGLHDANGKVLKTADSGRAHVGERISQYGIRGGGTWLLSVRPQAPFMANHTIPYALTVRLSEYRPGYELEPNDVLVQANPVEVNTEVSGRLFPVKDVDFFEFIVPQPGNYSFSARVKDVPGVDIALALYGPNGQLLSRANAAGVGEAEQIANVGISAAGYDSRFRLAVEAVSGENQYEEYRLFLSIFEAGMMGEFEPNDERAQANPLSIGTEKKGMIFPSGDRDWYRFDPAGAERVRIEVSGVSGVDLVVRLHDGDGKLIAEADEGGVSGNERLVADLKRSGPCYLEIFAKQSGQANAQDSYTIMVRKAD